MQVLVELAEGLVAPRHEVHLDAVDQRLERRPRQVEALDHRHQRRALRCPRRAAFEAGGELRAPARDLGRDASGVDRRGLIGRVVDGAAEVPHRDDGVALRRGQHEERVVEVGVARQESLPGC